MRSRRFFIGLFTFGVMIFPFAQSDGAAEPDPEPKPYNFIVMMADDLGAKELSCYGNQKHSTPHLDKMAAEGMRFRTCYATPICTSTRVMIMTGRYGFRTGYFNFKGRAYAPMKDSPQFDIGSKFTFADALKSAGYATAIAGKWQLTGSLPTRVHDCGFDEYRLWAYKQDLPPGVKHTGAWENVKSQKTSRFWHPSIMQNGKYFPTTARDYGPDLFTDFLVDFATRHKDDPFCLYYPMALTHTPWAPTPDLKNPGEKTLRGLKTNVEYMDHLVGRVIAAVDKLGLAERTIIIFTGDNGTGRSGKGQVNEMGARVPLIVRCPGTVEAGVVSNELVDLTDILPTLADFAGAKLPEDHIIDGLSLLPTLVGIPGQHRRWCFSYLADGRILRSKRWLMYGKKEMKLFDCGESRDGKGYRDVTDSLDANVVAARKRFTAILYDLPGPEGFLGLNQPGRKNSPAKKTKKKSKKTPAS